MNPVRRRGAREKKCSAADRQYRELSKHYNDPIASTTSNFLTPVSNNGVSQKTTIHSTLAIVSRGVKNPIAMDDIYNSHNPLLLKLGKNVGETPYPRIIQGLRKSQFHL